MSMLLNFNIRESEIKHGLFYGNLYFKNIEEIIWLKPVISVNLRGNLLYKH